MSHFSHSFDERTCASSSPRDAHAHRYQLVLVLGTFKEKRSHVIIGQDSSPTCSYLLFSLTFSTNVLSPSFLSRPSHVSRNLLNETKENSLETVIVQSALQQFFVRATFVAVGLLFLIPWCFLGNKSSSYCRRKEQKREGKKNTCRHYYVIVRPVCFSFICISFQPS